jgi:protein-S-isoprenylcysteine O-methyltransferase Ste14
MDIFASKLRYIGATCAWEFLTRISIGLYFSWTGLSSAEEQVTFALKHDFQILPVSHVLDFAADAMGTVLNLAAAVLVFARYRRLATTETLQARLVALLGAFYFMLVQPYLPKQELSPILNMLSILLVLTGSGCAIVVLMFLGRSFSILPEARHLVVSGPYSVVRHPLYAAEAIAISGFMMQFALWPAMIAFLIQFVFQFERMRMEEQILGKTFGTEYKAYSARTARLIPGIW